MNKNKKVKYHINKEKNHKHETKDFELQCVILVHL